MVDEDEVVFLDLIPHQKEYEGEEGADWHRHGENERHAHNRECERLIVSKLEDPVVFVRPMPHPIQECEETFPGKVRYVKHLDAVSDEDDLDKVLHNERCHSSNVCRYLTEEVLKCFTLDEDNNLLVRDQAGQRQN